MTQTNTVRIAVDTMGGDFGPTEMVAGAVAAARARDVSVVLVGDSVEVKRELAKYDAEDLPLTILPSEGVVVEGESPLKSFRQKPNASILVATGAVKKGMADAVVTMGSTGAAMAAAVVVLGVIEGIDRPCLGGPIIGYSPTTIIVDVGTSVDCRPHQLASFAVTGDVFSRQFWGVNQPRVAILSVGSEVGKGDKLVKDTTELMAETGVNFIGNIEGNDLPNNKADVVVCDGFVGNVVMKLTEGLGSTIVGRLRERLQGHLVEDKLNEALEEIYNLTNMVQSYGGGPILGVNGVSVVGHGRARADGVAKAISTAERCVETKLIPEMNARLNATSDVTTTATSSNRPEEG